VAFLLAQYSNSADEIKPYLLHNKKAALTQQVKNDAKSGRFEEENQKKGCICKKNARMSQYIHINVLCAMLT